jgi:hypothetical protein
MLRASFQKSTKGLLGSCCSSKRSIWTSSSLRPPATLREKALVFARRPLAVISQVSQRRTYAIAIEESSKGVVSFAAIDEYLSLTRLRIPMTPSYRGIPRITLTKCTWPGKKTPRAFTSPGKHTSTTWKMGTCPSPRRSNHHLRLSQAQ